MSPPIDIDGSEIQKATIDGQNVNQVTIDGQEVFDGIPDAAGEYLIVGDRQDNTAYQKTLSTAYDITAASDAGTRSSNVTAVEYNRDGSKYYEAIRSSGGDIEQFSLSTLWDITTASSDKTANIGGPMTDALEIMIGWSVDGSRFYATTRFDGEIHQFDPNTKFDIGSLTHTATTSVPNNASPAGFVWESGGNKIFISDVNNQLVRSYTTGSSWDIGSLTQVATYTIGSALKGLTMNNDGSRLIACQENGDVTQHDMSTEFDLSSASQSGSLTVGGNSNCLAIAFPSTYA